MKRIFTILILATVLFSATAMAAPNPKVRGTIKDTNGEPVGFCNVVFALASDSLNIRGDISNAEGFFDMNVPAGEYQMTVAMMGYEPYQKTITLGDDTNLGTIILSESAVSMDAAVVTADMVRRKADGYMFLPAGSAITTGRNSMELLNYAPGVWVDKDRGITVNGKSGTRVMVNDRILKLSDEELTAYLESIDAEQIRSIEVIPDPGAQYDADAQGGILKITLKRTMNGGLNGSVGMDFRFHDNLFPGRTRPSFNLEYRKDRLSVYTNFYYQDSKHKEHDHEYTKYESDDNREIDGELRYDGHNKNFSGRIGSVYELTDRQSIGLDFDYFKSKNDQDGTSEGVIRYTGYEGLGLSRYTFNSDRYRYNLSFNYKLKTDEKGSSLMVMADYMYNHNDQFENNHATEDPITRALIETNRNTDRLSKTDYYTFRTDYKHYINQNYQLEAGAKYAYTDMDTDIKYTDEIGGVWVPDEDSNDHYLYREGVLAGYVNGSANLGRWNLSAGLRVENTELKPRSFVNPGETKNQNYTDLFPTARIVYQLNQEKGHLINASYTRRINRPGFDQLNPFRIQLNNYTYIVGNPDMKPSYMDSFTLTGVISNKYSLTLGYNNTDGAVRQVVAPDPNDPEILLYQHRNMDRILNYFASLSVPVQIQPWWRVNVDAHLMHSENKLETYNLNNTSFMGRINNLFTLPQNWSAEVNYSYMSSMVQGNMELDKAMDFLNVSIKKSFFDNRLTASFSVDNVLDNGSWNASAIINEPGKFTKRLDMRNTGFPSRRYAFSLRWNFKAGKDIRKVQKVTAGNEEERGR